MTKTLIVLSNGSTVWTEANTAADIAMMINAGGSKTYAVIDTEGQNHHIAVAAIVDVQDVATSE